jgi:hypothetical protein
MKPRGGERPGEPGEQVGERAHVGTRDKLLERLARGQAVLGLGTRRTSMIDDLLSRNVYAYRVLPVYCRCFVTNRLS